MMAFIRFLLLFLLVPVPALGQHRAERVHLTRQIDEILGHHDFDGARWGALIVNLDTGEHLYERNVTSWFVPASNQKLVTTAAALDAFGPDHEFETSLYADGEIRDNTLYGSLVVRGAGDPTIRVRNIGEDLDGIFRTWAARLHDLGITRVQHAQNVRILGRSTSSMRGPNASSTPYLETTIDFSDDFIRLLRSTLEAEGIDVDLDAIDVDPWGLLHYEDMRLVASHRSLPLDEIIRTTNTDSHNRLAENILKALGTYHYHGTEHAIGSTEAGTVAVEPFLTRIGILMGSIRVIDGSGLSKQNRLTPQAIVTVLDAMHTHQNLRIRRAFYRSLSVGGVTGTLERRYRSGFASGNVHAKTGYVRGARTLSGYVDSQRGHRIAFSLLCNNYATGTRRVERAQDAVVELLAGLTW